jgi:hypothetical protein
MTKQASFAKGELTPSLYARTDLAAYATGLRTARNGFIAKQGGWYNRPGTTFVNAVKNSASKVRLVEFVFSDDDTYILEFGIGYIRFYRNGAQITVSSVTAWSSSTAYVVGDIASSGGVNYYCTVSHTNHVPPNTSYWYALTGSIFEIPNPFTTEDELAEFQYTQSNDVMVIVHRNHAPRELIRSGHTSWIFRSITMGPNIALSQWVLDFTTMDYVNVYPGTASDTGGSTTYYVAAVSRTGDESIIKIDSTTKVPGTFNSNPASNKAHTIYWGNGTELDGTAAVSYKIWRVDTMGYTTSGLLKETTGKSYTDDGGDPVDPGDMPPAQTNQFQSSGNYPGVALYSQQRLFLGSTENDPDKIWGSRIGSFYNFLQRVPVRDDDALSFTIVGRQTSQIRNFAESRQLIILTSSSEWGVNGDSNGSILPDSINAKQQSNRGSAEIMPVTIGNTVLYAQARGSVIRDIGYDFQQDGYTGNDITIFSSHLFEGKTIVDWAYAQTPNSIAWVVLDDGSFLSLTYIKEQEMLAWTRHDTDGLVENVAVIPDGNEDRVYFVVKRTINGSTVRYIEKMETRVIADIEDAVFMDSSLTYDSTPTATVTGLDHLEGEDVAVFADGFVVASPNNPAYKKITVSGGSITLDDTYSTIHVGLPYLSDIETLGIDSFSGEKKIITRLNAFIEKSRGFFAGSENPGDTTPTNHLTETKLRTTESYDEPIELKTEEVDLNIRGKYSDGGRVFIRNVDPLPLAVLSIEPGGFMAQGGR